jgi:hypothetical protein
MPEFLNIELMNWEDFWDLVMRAVFNLAVVLVLVRILYYQITPRKEYLFTYILISMVVFFMIMLLENVGVEIGFALGLFAIFGMLRYRTQQIPIREMTYLFLVIGVSVINSLANRRVSYAELLLTNFAIILITYLLEKVYLMKTEIKKQVFYEKIDLIKPEMRDEMIADLKERTGLPIHRVEIDRIDYLRDSARIYVYYFEKDWRNTEGSYQRDDNDD